jgi:hypothetical protein
MMRPCPHPSTLTDVPRLPYLFSSPRRSASLGLPVLAQQVLCHVRLGVHYTNCAVRAAPPRPPTFIIWLR